MDPAFGREESCVEMSWSISYGIALRITAYHGDLLESANIHSENSKSAWAVPISSMTPVRVLLVICPFTSWAELRIDVQGHLLKDLVLHRVKHHKNESCSSVKEKSGMLLFE